jgi:hypothetical protein
MQIRQSYQISELNVTDDQGNEYTLVEYQNGTETRSLKLLTAGQSWFALADGTPVDKIDDATFRILTNDTVLHTHTQITGQGDPQPSTWS